jgi:hypothetical protein
MPSDPLVDDIVAELRWRGAANDFFKRLPSFLRPEGFKEAEIERIIRATKFAFRSAYGLDLT